MKISALITALRAVVSEVGDLEAVVITDHKGSVPVAGIAIGVGDSDKPIEVTICDQDTYDCFIEEMGDME